MCTVSFISCSKEGPTGPKGNTGTAKVIYSDWKYAEHDNRDTIIVATNQNLFNLLAPEITKHRLDSAVTLLVYLTWGSDIHHLPYTSYAGGSGNTIDYFTRVGEIILSRFTFDNSNTVKLSNILQYSYVIIPGGVAGGTKSLLSYGHYRAVCIKYGIPE